MYNQPTSIRIPKMLKDFLRRRADADNRKLSQMIVMILEQWRSAHMKARHNKPGEEQK
jgi:fructose-1,6-bisphosphatase/sedoheptulose 1,7-bisphosphatase-like protein